jgi:hypothetical protein
MQEFAKPPERLAKPPDTLGEACPLHLRDGEAPPGAPHAAFLSLAPCFRAGLAERSSRPLAGRLLPPPPRFPPRPAIQGSPNWLERTAGQGLPVPRLRAAAAGAASGSAFKKSPEDAPQ